MDKELSSNKKILEDVQPNTGHVDDKDYVGGLYSSMPRPRKLNWLIVATISFFIVVLIVGLSIYVMSLINTQKKEINWLKEQVILLNDGNNTEYIGETVTLNDSNNSPNISYKYEIRVDALSSEGLSSEGLYRISLIGQGTDSLKGKWVSDGFDIPDENVIEDNIIIAKRTSSDTIRDISYMVGDECIATISVKVK